MKIQIVIFETPMIILAVLLPESIESKCECLWEKLDLDGKIIYGRTIINLNCPSYKKGSATCVGC